MAFQPDEIDVKLLTALQVDADRTNLELSRIAGLSPAATLNRVKKLKDSGVIRRIAARPDPEAAGFPLNIYLSVTLDRHDEAAEKRFNDTVKSLPQIITADIVAGETDAILAMVARDVLELQQVLAALSTRGGAQRLITYLRLARIKDEAPLPL